MWLTDKYGNGINSDQLLSLYVAANPDSSGYYEVQANNSGNTLVAQFATSSAMSEADAESLQATLLSLLGVYEG